MQCQKQAHDHGNFRHGCPLLDSDTATRICNIMARRIISSLTISGLYWHYMGLKTRTNYVSFIFHLTSLKIIIYRSTTSHNNHHGDWRKGQGKETMAGARDAGMYSMFFFLLSQYSFFSCRAPPTLLRIRNENRNENKRPAPQMDTNPKALVKKMLQSANLLWMTLFNADVFYAKWECR